MLKYSARELFVTILSILIVSVGVIFAGSITPDTDTPEPTFYTLEDIYQKMTDPNYVYEEHELAPIDQTDQETMHSVDDIFNNLKTLDSSTSTLVAGVYPETDLAEAETDLVAEKIKSDVSLFGVTGTYSCAP